MNIYNIFYTAIILVLYRKKIYVVLYLPATNEYRLYNQQMYKLNEINVN